LNTGVIFDEDKVYKKWCQFFRSHLCVGKKMIFAKFEASWDTLLNLEKKIPS